MSQARVWFLRRTFLRQLRSWLPVLALVIAGPLSGAALNDDQVIVPNSAVPNKATAVAGGTGNRALTIAGVILLGGAGGWMLLRARAGGLKQFNRTARQLAVEETRPLGNRQFLVVASYQDKKFLIGVCPGRIELLSALSSNGTEPEKVRS
ncbi:MAG: flagellar biosynthetic protein FliO [Opitutus sp.]